MRVLACCVSLAVVLPASAAAAPPLRGVFVPGESLGRLRLGMTPAQVRKAWGPSYGRCRSCKRPTWYFNYRPFEPQGAGVEFDRGRVSAIFTLWAPRGWHVRRGVAIGDPESRLRGAGSRTECGRYHALLRARRSVVSTIYVADGKVWGFGLFRAPAEPCR